MFQDGNKERLVSLQLLDDINAMPMFALCAFLMHQQLSCIQNVITHGGGSSFGILGFYGLMQFDVVLEGGNTTAWRGNGGFARKQNRIAAFTDDLIGFAVLTMAKMAKW